MSLHDFCGPSYLGPQTDVVTQPVTDKMCFSKKEMGKVGEVASRLWLKFYVVQTLRAMVVPLPLTMAVSPEVHDRPKRKQAGSGSDRETVGFPFGFPSTTSGT